MPHGHGFSVYRMGAASRRGLVLAGLAVALVAAGLAGGLPASAHTPETGSDPSVTLTVTPSDNVSEGAIVTVTGFGFPTFTDGVIRQCAGTVGSLQCDPAVVGNFKTASTHNLPPTLVPVRRYINGGATNCGVEACALQATAGDKVSQHHVSILGAGTSLPPPPSSSTTAAPPPPPTTIPPPPSTIPPGSSIPPPPPPTTSVPPTIPNLLCAILGPISRLLGGLLDGLLVALGCPPPTPPG
jgi:hypothetical protein